MDLGDELRVDGATSKAWTTQDGRVRVGKPVDKSLIYKLLNNRTYLGELRHKVQWYPGQHEPIIDKKLWGDVQTILATNGRQRGNATRALVPFLLKGLVFGPDGRALTGSIATTCRRGRTRSMPARRACRACRPPKSRGRCWNSCGGSCARRRSWLTV